MGFLGVPVGGRRNWLADVSVFPLKPAWFAKIEQNRVASAAGVQLSETPTALSFARELKVLIWNLDRIG
jgi:hypothetical protein